MKGPGSKTAYDKDNANKSKNITQQELNENRQRIIYLKNEMRDVINGRKW